MSSWPLCRVPGSEGPTGGLESTACCVRAEQGLVPCWVGDRSLSFLHFPSAGLVPSPHTALAFTACLIFPLGQQKASVLTMEACLLGVEGGRSRTLSGHAVVVLRQKAGRSLGLTVPPSWSSPHQVKVDLKWASGELFKSKGISFLIY